MVQQMVRMVMMTTMIMNGEDDNMLLIFDLNCILVMLVMWVVGALFHDLREKGIKATCLSGFTAQKMTLELRICTFLPETSLIWTTMHFTTFKLQKDFTIDVRRYPVIWKGEKRAN